jgi:AraC family transcriptional activator of pyochelin receptor
MKQMENATTPVGAKRAKPLPAHNGNGFYDGMITLTNGRVAVDSVFWETEPLAIGMKFIIVEDGGLICKLPGSRRSTISGPCICAVWNNGQSEGMQSFLPGCVVPYTTVLLSDRAIKQQLTADFEHLRRIVGIDEIARPHLAVAATTKPLHTLCAQVATCPLKGLPRRLYLGGKALEIAALALTAFDPLIAPQDPHLSTADIERIHLAADILSQRLQSPPSLSELGLTVGLNVRKLKVGFRRVFDDSVFGYLQTLRLNLAYRLLAEGEMNVSCAAYHVGYSSAHFSVAFRKRFGSSPSCIRS